MYSKVIGIGRHKVLNPLAQEDHTYENYLRLIEAILVPQQNGSTIGVNLSDLYDSEESAKRMKEIDELRARGEKTPYESTNENTKLQGNRNLRPQSIITECYDEETKETKVYNSLKELCLENNLNICYVRTKFRETDKEYIWYKGKRIKKLGKAVLNLKRELPRVYLREDMESNLYCGDEKAYVVQMKDKGYSFSEIAMSMDRTSASCNAQYAKLRKLNLLDFYRNIDISDKIGAKEAYEQV